MFIDKFITTSLLCALLIKPVYPDFQSSTYKQGIYTISTNKSFEAVAELITSNKPTGLAIIDAQGHLKFYKQLETVNQRINLGNVDNGDSITVVGAGEVAITLSYK